MSDLLCRPTFHSHLKTRLICRILILRRCLRSMLNKVSTCWIGDSVTYRQIQDKINIISSSPAELDGDQNNFPSNNNNNNIPMPVLTAQQHRPSDVVPLKISLLGDCRIGKTSFLEKYVEKENEHENMAMTRNNQMYKTLSVGGACISYSIWEVGGVVNPSSNQIQEACTDSVALLFMFDLTSRCTLNSVVSWYNQARKWNQTAIPVLVGTKFDDFVQLPMDLQWTIASEARTYAKALNATLFFSSATYNINVNKIFKFVTAKLFNLPWTMERNLTMGEPLIDY